MGSLRFTRRRAKWVICLGLLLLAPLVIGCGKANGKLSGRVLLNGTPLPGGRVTFRPADPKSNPVVVDLDEEGKYRATLPVGEVQVSVDNRELEPRAKPIAGSSLNLPPEVRKAMGKANEAAPPTPPPAENSPSSPPKPRGKYVAIPPKYYTIEDSGLKYTIEPGDHQQDIELKSDR
jgi:hypothetical protein